VAAKQDLLETLDVLSRLEKIQAELWILFLILGISIIRVYQRTGRYCQAVSQIDVMTKTRPKRADLKNARALFAAFAQYPEQSVTSHHPSSVRYRMKDGIVSIPVSVNHRPVTCLVDTGANFSLLSESEARRLGLVVHNSGGHQTTDAAGLQVGVRIAIADRLEVGHFQLRNVPFIAMGDNQGPFPDLPEGKRGAIGLPVLLAFQTMRWDSKGNFEIGFASVSQNGMKSNMCFEGVQPFEAEFRQKTIQALLDTGAGVTRALPLFARDFANFTHESGQEEPQQVTGMAGSVKVDVVTLPELTLRVGGFNAVLHPAQVLLKETTSDIGWCHVWIGMDMLNQVCRVTLDFKSMRITLE
jgi:predicted aspartyl protease